jgi:hypothetical protein
MNRFLTIPVVVVVLVAARPAVAAESPVGTWVRTDSGSNAGVVTMTIEDWGKGNAKLTFRFKGSDTVLTIVSPLDGSDVPVLMNGKPSGETMGIKLIDKYHSLTVIKMNGKQFGVSKGTYSDDFTKLTVENDVTSAAQGQTVGKTTETWVRK